MAEAEERLAFVQEHLDEVLAGVAGRRDVDPSAIVVFVLDLRDPLGSAFAAGLGVDPGRVGRVGRVGEALARPGKSLAAFVPAPLALAIELLRTHRQPKIAEAIETLPIPPRGLRIVAVARGGASATAAVLPEICPRP